ncbi:MAG TPA: hypothetical protein VFV51_19325, partial [Vicinamibacterales bacterium]|nr:hypothetical protein [Vicinamibacterales bacterium]
VDPENPDEIADRLGRVLRDRERAARMGEMGRAIALERFHPGRVAQKTHDVYLQAAHRASVGAPVG